ncbi:hypothetical protein VM1G_07247 [Cytospora mali]|uniref:DUF7730 domain-containing protein n=1 Tax=Cytospora mali TaxID=578113 RepID=A0A194W591_CYTMA|nr:hypothetical protein VM1G_07247 [Valsa mali]
MPPPILRFLKPDNTEKTLDHKANRSPSNANFNHHGKGTTFPTLILPLGNTRKRPAKDSPENKANKRHQVNRLQYSPSTTNGPWGGDPARSSFFTPSVGPVQHNSGSPPCNTTTPLRPKPRVAQTDPGPRNGKTATSHNLTDTEGPISPLAHRPRKTCRACKQACTCSAHSSTVTDQNVKTNFQGEHQEKLLSHGGQSASKQTPGDLESQAWAEGLNPSTLPTSSHSIISTQHPVVSPKSALPAHQQELTQAQATNLATPELYETPELIVPVSHELPSPVPRGDVNPVMPQRGATGDRTTTAEPNNASKRQLQVQGGTSESDYVDDGGDRSDDEDYRPRTPLRKSSGKRSTLRRTPLPRTPSRKRTPKRNTLRQSSRPSRPRRSPTKRDTPQRPASQRPDIPIGNKCFFLRLPLEVRRLIYRYLLRAGDPIQVLNGWSQLLSFNRHDPLDDTPDPFLTPNGRPKVRRLQRPELLCTAVLSVSRTIFDEAVQVLYAENKFRCLLRNAQAETVGFKAKGNTSNRTIDFKKYAHYFRNLELRVEGNWTGPEYGGAFARALEMLKGNGVNLYKLTIEMSPRWEEGEAVPVAGWFDQAGPVHVALTAMNTCFIQIHMFTPNTDADSSKSLRCVIDKRSEVSKLEVYQRRDRYHDSGSPIRSVDETRRQIQTEQADKAKSLLDQLGSHIGDACHDPELAVRQGWFEQFETWNRRIGYAGGEGPDDPLDEDYIFGGC